MKECVHKSDEKIAHLFRKLNGEKIPILACKKCAEVICDIQNIGSVQKL
tara:strand:+ start:2314 stop:2460 length:147 start_codon:yes stop_codon:yes gene_type:complete